MTLPPNAIERPISEQRAVSCRRTKIADASTGLAMLATGNNLAGKRAR